MGTATVLVVCLLACCMLRCMDGCVVTATGLVVCLLACCLLRCVDCCAVWISALLLLPRCWLGVCWLVSCCGVWIAVLLLLRCCLLFAGPVPVACCAVCLAAVLTESRSFASAICRSVRRSARSPMALC